MGHHIVPPIPLILFFPLIGAVTIALFGPFVDRRASAFVGTASVFLSFVITVWLAIVVWQLPIDQQAAFAHSRFLGYWVDIPPYLVISFRLLVDPLSIVWMLVVTGVGFLIHLYSVGYMAPDKNYRTFFAYMNLFVVAMLLLVMADNFLWLLVGWAGVGLASYLLIGFYYDRRTAVLAARKALIMNVIGDVGILIAIFLMYAHFGSVAYQTVFASLGRVPAGSLDWIGVWLFVGAVAKSAQLPLQTWLPDAMEGPTPVSALIHAATMVTAGVYLVARAHPIYDRAPVAAEIVAVVGGLTALFAATIGTVQYDIKRVLAYSTMSQIGYMMLAVGIGAYAAGAFHFVTHAFFKALLFMAAGIVIHNLSGEQDIRKMGGLAKRMPFAYWTFLAGTLAIAGIFPFAGFFSKDAILDQALQLHHPWLQAAGTIAAFLTAFYMFRLLYLTFFTGSYRGDHEPHHDSSWTMTWPVAILAVLALIGGWLVLPGRDLMSSALAASFVDARFGQFLGEFNWPLSISTLLLAIAGIVLAYALYQVPSGARDWLRTRFSPVRDLLMNAYYFDVIYHYAFEAPTYALADFFSRYFEGEVVGGIPRAFAGLATWFAGVSGGWEAGYLRRYGLSIVVGVALVLVLYLFLTHAPATLGRP